MADTSTIASLATAGGTLILAVATFSSTRSANRAARVSEQALQVGLRPVLFSASAQDPPMKVGFADDHWLHLHDGLGAAQISSERLYFAIPLRNVASGLAVLHGWTMRGGRPTGETERPTLEEFHRLQRDLYVPAGSVSFWQAALRDPDDPLYVSMREAVQQGSGITVDILYGDHEGGQRAITRFFMSPRTHGNEDEPWLWQCATARHWNLDRADPR
jgi:hypothetical protein